MIASIGDVKLIQLPKVIDERGNLSFIETPNQVPFDIERVYWIYDVPGGEIRGGHAFYKQEELIIAISGSFSIIVDDGINQKEFFLNRSYNAIYIPAGIWKHLENFSTNSFALILASTSYDAKDYIRDYNIYQKYNA